LEIIMVQSASADVSPPHPLLAVLEVPRALAEYASFTATSRLLSAGRSGHGRPVLLLPGMLADDRSTRPLRRLLNTAGYAAYGWKLGTNVGPTRRIINGIDEVLDDITGVHGEPVSIIGWSLGGMLGHDLARRHPGTVDRLITLASPLYIVNRRQSRASLFYDEYGPAHLAEYAMDTWRVPSVSSVPATSIFSKTDGVVRWETCVHPSGPLTENIEVCGSHCGLGFHSAAAYAILDRLAVPADPWTKFVPPGWLAIHFPTQPDTTRHSRASRIA
jgi:pimeloyl-ACP methyl ester carboxylesterase